MLIRVGTCTSCDATFQLPPDFESPWVRCSICEGAVQVGEPVDPAEATKRRRKGGTSRSPARSAGKRAGGAAAATLEKSAETAAQKSARTVEDAGDSTSAVLDEMDLDLEEMELIVDALDGPDAPAPSMPARSVPGGQSSGDPSTGDPSSGDPSAGDPSTGNQPAGKWSPAELERRAQAEAAEAERKAAEQAAAAQAAAKAEAEASARAAAEAATEAQARQATARAAAEAEAEAAGKAADAAQADSESPPVLVEVTRPKKKSGMSTLERLKAERAAAAAGAAPAAKPAEARGGTLERLKAERAAAAAAAARTPAKRSSGNRSAAPAQAATGKPAARATRSGSRRSSRAARGAGVEPEAAGGARRGRGQRKRGPGGLIGLGALAAMLAVGGVGWKLGWFDAPAPVVEPETEAVADAASEEPVEPLPDLFAAAGVPDAAEQTPAGDEQDPAAEAEGAESDAEDAAETPAEPAPAVDPARDPASIDLGAIADFERFPGTSDEDWETARRLAAKALDPYATRGLQKAKDDLIAMGRPAMPAILNELKELDVSDLAGASAGWIGVDIMTKIANGNGYSWKQAADADAQYLNKKSAQYWCAKWDEIKDSDADWAKFAKLDPVTLEPLSAEERNKPRGDS